MLDVSDLNIPEGTYTVINGTSLGETRLHLAAETDLNKWRLGFDHPRADLTLTFTP